VGDRVTDSQLNFMRPGLTEWGAQMPDEQPKKPKVEKRGCTLVLKMHHWYDNLDDEALTEAEQTLLACCDDPEAKAVVVDLSNTEFFGTSFLEVLFRAWSRMRKQGRPMVLAGLKGHPLEVVRVTKLDELWDIYDSVDSAIGALSLGQQT